MLTKKNTIYAIPGWGFESKIFEALKTPELACIGLDYLTTSCTTLATITNYLSKQLPNQCNLMGWSLGGLIAINIALEFSYKVNNLILLSSQPRMTADNDWRGISHHQANKFLNLLAKSHRGLPTKFVRLVNYPNSSASSLATIKKYLYQQEPRNLDLLLQILLTTDLRVGYQNLTSHVLHFVYGQDAVLNQNTSQLIKLNSHITIVEAKDLGHAGFIINPTMHLQTIKRFINHER